MTYPIKAYTIEQFHNVPAFTPIEIIGREADNDLIKEGIYIVKTLDGSELDLDDGGPARSTFSMAKWFLRVADQRVSKDVLIDTEKTARADLSRISNEMEERIRAAKDAIEAEYKAIRSDLSSIARQAARELESIRDEEVSPHEWEGKKVQRAYEVTPSRFATRTITKTAYGIIETVTKDSQFSASLRYSVPEKGRVIVRPIRKDGTPGLSFDYFSETAGWSLAE